MSTYRVIAEDLKTGNRIAEIPLAQTPTYSEKLNGVGAMSCSVKTTDPQLDRLLLDFSASEWAGRTATYVERDGAIVWGGLLWLHDYDSSTQILTLSALELWDYFRNRITTGLTFAATDQATIASTLVYAAISTPAAGGWVAVPGTPTVVGSQTNLVPATLHGVLRDRTYNSWENKPVGEAVEQLAAVTGGFDFAVELGETLTGITKTFRTYYPRKGAPAGSSGVVWEYGRNMVAYRWRVDGTKIASNAFGVGSGEGLAALRSVQVNTALLDAGWPQLDMPVSLKDYVVQANLDAATSSALSAASNAVALPEITVKADVDPVFGSWSVGDDCRIRIQDDRFPAGIDVYRRIVGYEASPGDGSEVVKIVLADPTTL